MFAYMYIYVCIYVYVHLYFAFINEQLSTVKYCGEKYNDVGALIPEHVTPIKSPQNVEHK